MLKAFQCINYLWVANNKPGRRPAIVGYHSTAATFGACDKCEDHIAIMAEWFADVKIATDTNVIDYIVLTQREHDEHIYMVQAMTPRAHGLTESFVRRRTWRRCTNLQVKKSVTLFLSLLPPYMLCAVVAQCTRHTRVLFVMFNGNNRIHSALDSHPIFPPLGGCHET